jgi:DNA-binding GntR family transcriptional regulator
MRRTALRHVSRKSAREIARRMPMRANLYQLLLNRIVLGELVPGTRVKEMQLAKEFGVSRTPIREALLRLEREGFVSSELARGFTVEPLSGREVRESYPIMWALEGLALRASARILPSLTSQLLELNSKFAASINAETASDLDSSWHEALLSGCPNQRLNRMLGELRSTLRRYERFYMLDSALIAESAHQHHTVINAILANDIAGAERALIENWRFGMETLLLRIGEA